jgi:hypothetical protein
MAKSIKPSMGCGYVVFFVLLLGGLALLLVSANEHEKAGGRWKKNSIAAGIIGSALVLGAGGYLKLARRLVREHAVGERVGRGGQGCPGESCDEDTVKNVAYSGEGAFDERQNASRCTRRLQERTNDSMG